MVRHGSPSPLFEIHRAVSDAIVLVLFQIGEMRRTRMQCQFARRSVSVGKKDGSKMSCALGLADLNG